MDRAIQDRERLLIEAAQKDPKRFAELYEENFCWLLPCYQVSFQLRRTPSPPPNQSSSG